MGVSLGIAGGGDHLELKLVPDGGRGVGLSEVIAVVALE